MHVLISVVALVPWILILSSSWHVPWPQRPHINMGSVKGLNIHNNWIPIERFNLLHFHLQSCNPPELIINHWHILHKTILDDILNSYEFPFECASFLKNLIQVNISLKRALCVYPPCTSMAGTQRRSLPRQTNLIEFYSRHTINYWSSTKRPNAINSRLPVEPHTDSVKIWICCNRYTEQ